MSSAIFLAEQYLTVPVFERYFRGELGKNDVAVGSVNGFRGRSDDKFLFSARGGDGLYERVYDTMEHVVAFIKTENDDSNITSKGSRDIRDWKIQFPGLIDVKPKVVGGVYLADDTAELLFPIVAWGYLATATGSKVNGIVKKMESDFRSLGDSLSNV